MKQRPEIVRAAPLLDLEVGSDGRTVTAYAATFGNSYPVSDEYGVYDEIINRAAFDRTLGMGFSGRVQPLFNHGRTLEGTPSEKWMSPLGVPLDIRAETKGLLTVTRYSKLPHAEEALQLIKDGAITAQSFRGSVFRSSSPRRGANGRTTIERTELGLRDYGPAVFAVNDRAGFVAIRSEVLADRLAELGDDLTDEERTELARLLTEGTHGTAPAPAADPPAPEVDETTPPAEEAPDPDVALSELVAAQRRRRS